jgi:labile enterotoxin output A
MKVNEAFENKQRKIIELLEKTLVFLKDGEKFNISIDKKLIDKVENSISQTKDEKLKVALIGAFSEGKTSIVATWAEIYDKSKMKISQLESSDEIEKFELENIIIIDTPGLFGSKENIKNEKYKDITKKYISEAHLVLYVMNPNNPIKESHKSDLQWLFKDLDLLKRTVFVIGRFDEEVDIEDEENYNEGLEIKKENVIGRLRDFGILDYNNDISIVGVSADPYGYGLEYWLANIEEFRRISHIKLLQQATTNKIETLGDKKELIISMQKSIVSDVLGRQLPIAFENVEKIHEECNQLKKFSEDMQYELKKNKEKIINVRRSLKDYIVMLFTDLILQANGTNLDTFYEFFQQNIGSEGIVLETKISSEFERQIGDVVNEIAQLEISYNAGIEHNNSILEQMAHKGIKMGGQFLKNGNINIANKCILAARDFFKIPFKFKPWGAVKLANAINGAIPIIGEVLGLGVDAWEMIEENNKKEKFKEFINKIIENLEKQRKELIGLIDGDDFTKTFFPSFLDMQKNINSIDIELEEKEKQKQDFENWKNTAEVIEVEFKEILC